ncbi:hypothetical protein LTS02_016378 [Friedmanniomyces endolithicus]|nr:hypothetical protein LTS02_016378 [Friedmanniomyces endolithicus]
MAAESEIACLALDPASIGTIKQGPVRKWIAKKREAEVAFGKDAKKLQKKKARELALGYDEIPGETPPPSALVGRRRRGVAPEEKKKQKNWGLALWSGWGSSHDESTLKREEKAEKDAEDRQGGGPVGEPGKVGHLTVEDRPQTGTAVSSGAPIPRPRNGTVHESRNKKRRTSSVSVFSSPWSQKQVVEEQRPRSRPNRVTDTGQAGIPSEGVPRAESSTRPPLSRRSSGSTTNSYASRPMSMAVPNAGDVAPDSYRVPGSQNTYLDPHSSRPHNRINAYPFRLRQPASNPSLATLDSKAASTYSARGEVVGTSVTPVEMPTHTDPPLAEMPTPANAHIEMPTPADEAYRWPESGSASEEPVSAISRNSTPHRELLPTTSRSGTPQREPVSAGSRSGTPRRDPMSAVSRTSTPQRESDLVGSPETPPKAMPFGGPAAIFDNRLSLLGAIGADGMPTAPLQGRKANAGSPKASGLPSPHSASSSMTRGVPAPAKSAEAEAMASSTIGSPPSDSRVAASAASEGLVRGRGSAPVTPVDGEKPATFKIRNPVYDARRAPTPANDLEAVEKSSPEAPAAPQVLKKAGEATDATKAAPFKLRHTVYDPSPAFGHAPVSRPSDPALPSAPFVNKDQIASPPAAPSQTKEALQAEQIATRATTPVDQHSPTHNDLPPNSHVVMPTLVARRPIAMWQNSPPQPPAKDEVGPGRRSPLAIGLDRKRSKELLSATRDRDRDRKTPSSTTTMATTMAERNAAVRANLLPKSKFSGASAPSIGDLGFEKTGRDGFGPGNEGRGEERRRQRPGLETFYTADEGEVGRPQGA